VVQDSGCGRTTDIQKMSGSPQKKIRRGIDVEAVAMASGGRRFFRIRPDMVLADGSCRFSRNGYEVASYVKSDAFPSAYPGGAFCWWGAFAHDVQEAQRKVLSRGARWGVEEAVCSPGYP